MPLMVRVLCNFLYKLIVFPVLIYFFPKWVPQLIIFPSLQPVILLSGLFIAIGLVADETILPWQGNLPATSQGFLFMSAAIWASSFFFPGADATVLGALLIGLALGISEYFMHDWLLKQRANKKHHRAH